MCSESGIDICHTVACIVRIGRWARKQYSAMLTVPVLAFSTETHYLTRNSNTAASLQRKLPKYAVISIEKTIPVINICAVLVLCCLYSFSYN